MSTEVLEIAVGGGQKSTVTSDSDDAEVDYWRELRNHVGLLVNYVIVRKQVSRPHPLYEAVTLLL